MSGRSAIRHPRWFVDLSNIILTGWGTEILPPEALQKFGYPDAAQPLEVAFAKAVFQETTWVRLMGLSKDLGTPELASAWRAIQLGQYVRKTLNLAADTAIVSAIPAAVLVARHQDATASWLPAEQLVAVADVCLTQGAPAIVPAGFMPLELPREIASPARLAAHQLQALLRQNDPLAVFVSMIERNDRELSDLLNDAQLGRQSGSLSFTAAHFQAWATAHQLVQERRLEAGRQAKAAPAAAITPAAAIAPAAIHLDAEQWRKDYPQLAAAWQRLEASERQAAGGATETAAMDLVRNLDHASLTCLGLLPRPADVPAFPASVPLLEHVRQVVSTMHLGDNPAGFFLHSKREHCRQVWRQLCMWLASGEIETLMQFVQPNKKDANARQLAAQMLGFETPRFQNVPLFPLSSAEKTLVTAHVQRQETMRALVREERRRQKEMAEERAREAFRQQEAEKLASVTALTPGRRAIAILKDETYWRGRWQDLQPEWQNAAEALKAKRSTEAADRAAAQAATRLRKRLAEPVPASRYLEVLEASTGVLVRFVPAQELTLGSASLNSDLVAIARRRLGKGQLKHPDGHKEIFQTEWNAPRLEALVARTEMKKLARALADIDAEVQAALATPLAPYHVEQVLQITKAERLRWTQAGRLKVVGKDSFYKGRTLIEYPLFSRTAIRAISAETIARWRAEDAAASTSKRKAGAARAVETRKRNLRLREEEQTRIDTLAREAARTLGDLTAVSLVKLAIYAQLASRWAKHFQALGRSTDSQHFYDLKDAALRVIAASPYARIAYVPSDQAKYHVDLCEFHYDEWREFRRYDRYVTFWDWVDMESDLLKACPDCDFHADYSYWALYLIELVAGDLRLSFHVPHSIGVHYLPAPKGLEKHPDESSEGMFRYGRPVDEEEMLLHPAPKVETAIQGLLQLFQRAGEAPATARRLPG
jgi:hypothetical protein